MRSLRGALAATVAVLSAACGDAGQPPAAPGAPIDPPRENPDLAAMMEASPSTPATTAPAPEPAPTASASAPAMATSAEAKPAEKKPAAKKAAEKKP